MNTIIERIEKFNAPLLPEMVQLKYKAMKQNAFRFFRGTCHLFYEDLAQAKNFPLSPLSWISGDLHLENFGSYKGNNRLVYFDLNDFDESMLAPLNWELARVLTSIYVAFDVLKLKTPIADEMATLFLNKYRETLKSGKADSIDPRTAKGTVRLFLNNAKKRTEKELIKKITDASRKKLTIKIDNTLHFKLKPKLKEALLSQLAGWLKTIPSWPKDYLVKDAAFRVAGTGSIGLKRYMFLLQNRKDKDSFLLLEMKEARASSLALYNNTIQPHWSTPAQRIITNKYRMQNVSPALLTTIRFKQASYVLQEMQPYDDKIRFELLGDKLRELTAVLTDMAILTASAQLRSSGIQGSAINDELRAFASRKQWQPALLAYAKKYANQVKADYKQFVNTLPD
ncbi:DUF2252 domain-containing protein [Pedobacter sp. KBW06]|uniref:DUF2252 domain-containing protein n=1 Tax=Pedobacter sp. KBW06 TaxID=2153359 RepID=UPI000F596A7F|nr:DUF2252 family protein [Pedobacter sp. KBW06]RQO69434.1 DUF2252 domain-containing protein [Pedobacter sp. KBW06]